MQPYDETKRIIFLNGPSSSGKSSLAEALCTRYPEQFTHFQADHLDQDCLNIDENDDAITVLKKIAIAAENELLDGNKTLVIDTVAFSDACAIWFDVLGQYNLKKIAVSANLSTLNQREEQRQDRRQIGFAQNQHKDLFQGYDYDYNINTTHITPQQCAEELYNQISTQPSPDQLKSTETRNAQLSSAQKNTL